MSKLKIAVLNPNWGFISGERSMHLWAAKFIEKYCERELNHEEAQDYKGDVIIQLSGRPDLPFNCPPKQFKGLKLCHLFDHVFQTLRAVEALKENEVDYLLCYNRHDKYDSFFRSTYTNWIDKVIAVPFGYNNKRFSSNTLFNLRKNKCVALGSVNPVKDPLCINDIHKQKWNI